MVTECQLTHSHPACPLEFAYYFRPGHLLANACLPVRTTNKISKQFVAPADVRRLLSYCKGRDHGVLDALHVLEGLFRTDPEAKVGSWERQCWGGGEPRLRHRGTHSFIRPLIHALLSPSFLVRSFHKYLRRHWGGSCLPDACGPGAGSSPARQHLQECFLPPGKGSGILCCPRGSAQPHVATKHLKCGQYN